MDKRVTNADEALKGLKDGMTLMVGGFGLSFLNKVPMMTSVTGVFRTKPSTSRPGYDRHGMTSKRSGQAIIL